MSKSHQTRSMKLQPELITRRYFPTELVPKLLLKGKWFQVAGFEPGMMVSIKVESGRLIIEPNVEV